MIALTFCSSSSGGYNDTSHQTGKGDTFSSGIAFASGVHHMNMDARTRTSQSAKKVFLSKVKTFFSNGTTINNKQFKFRNKLTTALFLCPQTTFHLLSFAHLDCCIDEREKEEQGKTKFRRARKRNSLVIKYEILFSMEMQYQVYD